MHMPHKESAELVGKALDILRCSQKDLALKLGVSTSQVSQWRSGHSPIPPMRKEQLIGLLNPLTRQSGPYARLANESSQAGLWGAMIESLKKIALADSELIYADLPLGFGASDAEKMALSEAIESLLRDLWPEVAVVLPFEEQGYWFSGDDTEQDRCFLTSLGDRFEPARALYLALRGWCVVHEFYMRRFDYLAKINNSRINEVLNEIRRKDLIFLGFSKETESASLLTVSPEAPIHLAVYRCAQKVQWVKTLAAGFDVPLQSELLDLVRFNKKEMIESREKDALSLVQPGLYHPDIYKRKALQQNEENTQLLRSIFLTLEQVAAVFPANPIAKQD